MEHYEKLCETQEQGGNWKFLSAGSFASLSQEYHFPTKGACR